MALLRPRTIRGQLIASLVLFELLVLALFAVFLIREQQKELQQRVDRRLEYQGSQLALQATLGLSYRRSVYKWSSNGSSASDGTNTFGTQVNADPWAIFKDAISATYYL